LGILDPRDDREQVRAWLALQSVLHLDPVSATRLLQRTGDPIAALQACGHARALEDPSLGARCEALGKLGASVLPLPAPGYPERLRVLSDAAPVLCVLGEPAVLLGRAVAIVGARAPTVYGIGVARDLAAALARAGVVVVSGLARGIDAAAHRAALEAGGLTVAFSACGLDRTYPAEHASLADDIVRNGAVVTEMPLETPPLARYFPLRNRLISGLAEVVVVVEGRLRSGSLITARLANDQGRDVMAVPGPIGAPTSQGPNRLLREGAAPVTRIADVFEMLDLPVPDSGPVGHAKDDAISPLGARILKILQREPCTRDALGVCVGSPPGRLALALTELELAGRIAMDRDGCLRVLRQP
jgi:DNA processing protein